MVPPTQRGADNPGLARPSGASGVWVHLVLADWQLPLSPPPLPCSAQSLATLRANTVLSAPLTPTVFLFPSSSLIAF